MRKLISVLTVIALSFSLVALPASAAGEDKVVAKGVDVSYVQGNDINWEKVKAAGYSFAILRISYSTKHALDTSFEINYQNAKAAGVHVGCYMYSYAITEEQAIEDANEVIGWLKDKQLEYPIYYDMEDKKLLNNGLSTEQRTKIALAFVKTLQASGYYAGVYANLNWFTNYLNFTEIQAVCDTWIAHYTSGKDYSDSHGMWQHSQTGTVDGIKGNVDLDVCYRDYPTIIKNGMYNGFEREIIYAEPSGIRGDVDGNGIRDLVDVVTLAQYVAGWSGLTVVEQELNADRDGDNVVGLPDVIYLAQSVAGWYPEET